MDNGQANGILSPFDTLPRVKHHAACLLDQMKLIATGDFRDPQRRIGLKTVHIPKGTVFSIGGEAPYEQLSKDDKTFYGWLRVAGCVSDAGGAKPVREPPTPDPLLTKSGTSMPAPLGQIHRWLYDDLGWLHIKWSNFRRLYATSQEQLDLLSAAAPAFFHQLYQMSWEDVLLHLCRITDPPRSGRHGKHEHLTIMRISDATPDVALRRVVKRLVVDAERKTRFARDWRNAWLAHKALPGSQGQAAASRTSANYQNVEEALAALRKPMNHIEQHYLNLSVNYEQGIPALGGVQALLELLAKGLAAEKAELEGKLGG